MIGGYFIYVDHLAVVCLCGVQLHDDALQSFYLHHYIANCGPILVVGNGRLHGGSDLTDLRHFAIVCYKIEAHQRSQEDADEEEKTNELNLVHG